jgi:hypothetical protein
MLECSIVVELGLMMDHIVLPTLRLLEWIRLLMDLKLL